MRHIIAGIVLLSCTTIVRSEETLVEEIVVELQNKLTLQRELRPNIKTEWIDTFLVAYIRDSFRTFPSDAKAASQCSKILRNFEAWDNFITRIARRIDTNS